MWVSYDRSCSQTLVEEEPHVSHRVFILFGLRQESHLSLAKLPEHPHEEVTS